MAKLILEGISIPLLAWVIIMIYQIKSRVKANEILLGNHLRHEVQAVYSSIESNRTEQQHIRKDIERIRDTIAGLPCWYSERCYEIPKLNGEDDGNVS
jgi:hypothetical protein